MGQFFKTYKNGGAPATGSYKAPSLDRQTQLLFEAFQKYLPKVTEVSQANTEAFTPRQNKLDYEQFSQYAPLFSQAGASLQQNEVQNNLGNINNGGSQLVSAARQLEDLASPDFAKSRQVANKGFQDLIGGMDPNRLSGAEMANTERGINRLNARTGNLNTGDATSTTANAMTFGGALDQKRQNFGQALNLFPGIASQSKSGMDTFNVGTGKTINSNPGLSAFGGPQTKFDTQAGSFLEGSRGTQDARFSQLANRRTQSQAYNDISGSSCYGCYIFKEVYGYPDAPAYIRWCRDFFYSQDERIAKGYRRMSYWLVPLMQKHKTIRWFITYFSILPLAGYGQYLCGYKKWTVVFKPIAKLWINIWRYTGK